jgi:hypothetical protein
VSKAGFSPPLLVQSLPGPGLIDMICSRASNFAFNDGRSEAGIGLRLSSNRATGAGAGVSAAIAAALGLEPLLGMAFGLNEAANGFGLKSIVVGFNLPPCALFTPLERREKLGSIGLEGPVGGIRVSWIGIGLRGI